MTASDLSAAGSIYGLWEGRREQVHFFELRLDRLPDLRLDNREIVAARWMAPEELGAVPLTGPVASYLSRQWRSFSGLTGSFRCLADRLGRSGRSVVVDFVAERDRHIAGIERHFRYRELDGRDDVG
jgi:hypothetical protein